MPHYTQQTEYRCFMMDTFPTKMDSKESLYVIFLWNWESKTNMQ